jgi:hypothetical protein
VLEPRGRKRRGGTDHFREHCPVVGDNRAYQAPQRLIGSRAGRLASVHGIQDLTYNSRKTLIVLTDLCMTGGLNRCTIHHAPYVCGLHSAKRFVGRIEDGYCTILPFNQPLSKGPARPGAYQSRLPLGPC